MMMVIGRLLVSLRFYLLARTHRRALQQTVYRPSHQQVAKTRRLLERILTENIIPFWYSAEIDSEHGGFRLNHDFEGRWRGPAPKHVVAETRSLWFFSRLMRTPYGTESHLEAARHGYEFIRDHMWDKEYGGFYWEVDASGSAPTKPGKHLIGQAFGLYALTEYAQASGDPQVRALAEDLFGVLERYAHDAVHGGYQESFLRDWRPTLSRTYLNLPSGMKLLNTHLHLLEAVTSYCQFTGDPRAYKRLVELVLINANTLVNSVTGMSGEGFTRDWRPVRILNRTRVNYGHDLERIWLLIDACKATGISDSLLSDSCRRTFDYAVKHGFDRRNGGFYEAGPLLFRPTLRDKVWWVQAESMLGALYLYQITGAKQHWECFSRTLDWIAGHQVDWQRGGWYLRVTKDGIPIGDKANAWKDPYHEGRAMIMALEMLSEPESQCAG